MKNQIVGSIVFGSISNPNLWDIGETKKLVFSSPSEAERGEKLFKSIQAELESSNERVGELVALLEEALLDYRRPTYNEWRRNAHATLERARAPLGEK